MHVCPATNLCLPVRQRGDGSHHDEGILELEFLQDGMHEERALHGLAEPHFICQNAVTIVEPVPEKPIDAFDLVRSQLIPVLERHVLIDLFIVLKRRSIERIVNLVRNVSISTLNPPFHPYKCS